MPRKGHIAKRDVLPDPMYNSKLVTKLINNIMLDGKKGTAQGILYGAFKKVEEITNQPPIEVFEEALNNIKDVQLKKMSNALSWHAVSSITTMAFDHKLILDTCLQVLQRKIQEEPIIFNLLEKRFSLRDLQLLFEQILGIEFDRRNFRKKLFTTGLLTDVGEMEKDVKHRPGKLYTFNHEAYEQIKKKSFVGIQF